MNRERLKPTYRVLYELEAMRGTSLQGHLTASYTHLVGLFGDPLQGEGRKVDVQWIIETEVGVGTIYNYNLSEQVEVIEDRTDWHVGGKDEETYRTIVEIVQGT